MDAPSHIDGARVLKVARLDGTRGTGVTRHFRDGNLQIGFTRLALAQYEGGEGVSLFYCDDAWNSLNDTLHATIADAEKQAATEYERVSFDDP